MLQLEAKRATADGRFRRVAKYASAVVGSLILLWLAIRFASLITTWSLYSWFFERIRTVGALPDYLSGAIAVWCVAAVLLFTPAVFFSLFVKRNRKMVGIAAGAISLWMVFLYVISIPQQKNLFNPITGSANFSYSLDPKGAIHLFPRGYAFDPATGLRLQPLSDAIAERWRQQAAQDEQRKTIEAERQELSKLELDFRRREQNFENEKAAFEKEKQAQATPVPKVATALTSSAQTLREQVSQDPKSGPVVVIEDADVFRFGFWPCRRAAASVFCSGYVMNESGRNAYEGILPGDLKDNLGNEYAFESFTINNFSCFGRRGGCWPSVGARESQSIEFKADGIVSAAKSLVLYVHLTTQGSPLEMPPGFDNTRAQDFTVIIPIGQ